METKNSSRFYGMLGFAMRAGKVVIGTEQTLGALKKSGKARAALVLVAHDASDGTKKKLRTGCEFYNVERREINIDSAELGRLLGKTFAPAAVAITDDGFAKEISKALPDNTEPLPSEGGNQHE